MRGKRIVLILSAAVLIPVLLVCFLLSSPVVRGVWLPLAGRIANLEIHAEYAGFHPFSRYNFSAKNLSLRRGSSFFLKADSLEMKAGLLSFFLGKGLNVQTARADGMNVLYKPEWETSGGGTASPVGLPVGVASLELSNSVFAMASGDFRIEVSELNLKWTDFVPGKSPVNRFSAFAEWNAGDYSMTRTPVSAELQAVLPANGIVPESFLFRFQMAKTFLLWKGRRTAVETACRLCLGGGVRDSSVEFSKIEAGFGPSVDDTPVTLAGHARVKKGKMFWDSLLKIRSSDFSDRLFSESLPFGAIRGLTGECGVSGVFDRFRHYSVRTRISADAENVLLKDDKKNLPSLGLHADFAVSGNIPEHSVTLAPAKLEIASSGKNILAFSVEKPGWSYSKNREFHFLPAPKMELQLRDFPLNVCNRFLNSSFTSERVELTASGGSVSGRSFLNLSGKTLFPVLKTAPLHFRLTAAEQEKSGKIIVPDLTLSCGDAGKGVRIRAKGTCHPDENAFDSETRVEIRNPAALFHLSRFTGSGKLDIGVSASGIYDSSSETLTTSASARMGTCDAVASFQAAIPSKLSYADVRKLEIVLTRQTTVLLKASAKGLFPLADKNAEPDFHAELSGLTEKTWNALPFRMSLKPLKMRAGMRADWTAGPDGINRYSIRSDVEDLRLKAWTPVISWRGTTKLAAAPSAFVLEKAESVLQSGTKPVAVFDASGKYDRSGECAEPLAASVSVKKLDLSVLDGLRVAVFGKRPIAPGRLLGWLALSECPELDLSPWNGVVVWEASGISYGDDLQFSGKGGLRIDKSTLSAEKSRFFVNGAPGIFSGAMDFGRADAYLFHADLQCKEVPLPPFVARGVSGKISRLDATFLGKGILPNQLRENLQGNIRFETDRLSISGKNVSMPWKLLMIPWINLPDFTKNLKIRSDFQSRIALALEKAGPVVSGERPLVFEHGSGEVVFARGRVRLNRLLFSGKDVEAESLDGGIFWKNSSMNLNTVLRIGGIFFPQTFRGTPEVFITENQKSLMDFLEMNAMKTPLKNGFDDMVRKMNDVIGILEKK